ncbi:hypothetical protein GWI33_001835 [Rhynchophorus ferrugineus]|uniref:Uncharacterized protein n=1 Tax=Rhynchophorus ferrugineus TaxID=354439 RepID=A0A834IL00_RHYFE|nr:hypothetical protein GWI33_001835 [Rhynchophorus ferrugineus]
MPSDRSRDGGRATSRASSSRVTLRAECQRLQVAGGQEHADRITDVEVFGRSLADDDDLFVWFDLVLFRFAGTEPGIFMLGPTPP